MSKIKEAKRPKYKNAKQKKEDRMVTSNISHEIRCCILEIIMPTGQKILDTKLSYMLLS